MTGGSPSFSRSRLMVVFTAVVNGSAADVPDPFEQLLGGHDPVARREQAFEDGELLRAEVEPAPGPERHPACRVHGEVAGRSAPAAPRPTAAGPAPGSWRRAPRSRRAWAGSRRRRARARPPGRRPCSRRSASAPGCRCRRPRSAGIPRRRVSPAGPGRARPRRTWSPPAIPARRRRRAPRRRPCPRAAARSRWPARGPRSPRRPVPAWLQRCHSRRCQPGVSGRHGADTGARVQRSA